MDHVCYHSILIFLQTDDILWSQAEAWVWGRDVLALWDTQRQSMTGMANLGGLHLRDWALGHRRGDFVAVEGPEVSPVGHYNLSHTYFLVLDSY